MKTPAEALEEDSSPANSIKYSDETTINLSIHTNSDYQEKSESKLKLQSHNLIRFLQINSISHWHWMYEKLPIDFVPRATTERSSLKSSSVLFSDRFISWLNIQFASKRTETEEKLFQIDQSGLASTNSRRQKFWAKVKFDKSFGAFSYDKKVAAAVGITPFNA